MSIVSPVGGHVYNATVSVPVGRWTGNWQGRPAETTTTDGAGGTSYAVFVNDPQWEFTLPLDSSDAAVAAGFVNGMVLSNLALKLGNLSKCDLVQGTTVFGIRRELDASGQTPIAVTVTGGGGIITLNTNLPA